MPTQFAVAPLDSYTTRVTSGVAYLGGLLMLPLLFAYLSNLRWSGLSIPVAFAVVLALLLLLAFATQPVAYRLEQNDLVIVRKWLPALRIPLDKITAASSASRLSGIPNEGLRFAFNPGIFGYQGPFYLAPYGRAFLLATSREHLVSLARTADPPLILSPARPRLFIETLNTRLAERAAEAMQQNTSSPEAGAQGGPTTRLEPICRLCVARENAASPSDNSP